MESPKRLRCILDAIWFSFVMGLSGLQLCSQGRWQRSLGTLVPWSHHRHFFSEDSFLSCQREVPGVCHTMLGNGTNLKESMKGKSEPAKLPWRKVALDLFTFQEPLGPTENHCTSPLGYDMWTVWVCLYTIQKSHSKGKDISISQVRTAPRLHARTPPKDCEPPMRSIWELYLLSVGKAHRRTETNA
jgi:hypothetical protein